MATQQQEAIAPETTAPPRRRLDAAWVRRYGVYLAIGVVVAVNLVVTDNYLTTANLWTQLQQVAPVVIVALGMALVIGTGGIDLSVGSVMALSAAVMPLYLGYGTFPAVLIGMAIGLVTGAVAGILVARVDLQPIVATLGVMVAGRGLAAVISGQVNFTDPGLRELGTGAVLGVPNIIVAAIVAVAGVAFLVRRTVAGRELLAIGSNRRAAVLAGLRVTRTLIAVYMLCGLLAAVAGILVATRSQGVDPMRLGLLMELHAITAVVIGGASLTGGQVRVLGTVAGALLVQLFKSTLIAHNIPDAVSQMALAVIVVLAVSVQQVGRTTR
jgi:ribose/xylose/arabinose/galactoside ABC-type transport system permease subunit